MSGNEFPPNTQRLHRNHTLSGLMPRKLATSLMTFSVIKIACGAPKPRIAVLLGRLVLHTWLTARTFGIW